MTQTLITGYDNGRLYTKTLSTNQKVISLNAVSRGYELRQIETKEDLPENQMDFVLYEDDQELGRFFTGAMAVKNHNGDLVFSTSGMKKFSAEQTLFEKAKMFSAFALLAFKEGLSTNSLVEVFSGTGLPIESFFDAKDGNLDDFINEIIGKRYRVVFNTKVFENYSVELRVRSLEKTAEGTASLMGTMMKVEKNQLIRSNWLDQYLSEGPILVFNIGSSTSDIAVLKEDGTYDSRGFIGLEIGSEWALDYILRRLKEEHGYSTDKIYLEGLVLTGKNLRHKGLTIDLKAIAKEAYEMLFNKLRTELYEALRRANINASALGAIFYTGGTTEYMAAHLGSDVVKSMVSDVPGLLSTDSIFDDARGYLVMAYAAFMESKQREAGAIDLDPEEDVIEVS